MLPKQPDIETQITHIKWLLQSLLPLQSYQEKVKILDQLEILQFFLEQSNPIIPFIKRLTPESEYVIKSVIALRQGPVVFHFDQTLGEEKIFHCLLQLLEQLLEIEDFYRSLGGIIGYHLKMLELMASRQKPFSDHNKNSHFIHPEGLEISKQEPEVLEAVRWGIENTDRIAAIYPLGGAGDRLNLQDEETKTPLPAALLPFLGRTLLEGLIRELQAREYLFFKLYGKQITTPLAIMTSVEKNNHVHIHNICKIMKWFGREAESFYFFLQPLVPVLTIEGNWSLIAPFTLSLKPSGHGVMWKLAEDQGVFTWLESKGIEHCLVRQINNPLGSTDHALLALIGFGIKHKKDFGFLSCERVLNSEEGTNVLIETKKGNDYEYCLTNIEYTDFIKRGIGEHPHSEGSPFSTFPTNTNILFARLSAIRESLKICPIPGQLVNMKHKVSYIDSKGKQHWIVGGRLESTMQNIADALIDTFQRKLRKEEYRSALRTFLLYNKRNKTISVTKKLYRKGESPLGTPELAYYHLLSNHYELLGECGFKLPTWRNFEQTLKLGPSCLILFHPALGPLYSVIRQKIRGGELALDSELQLEIAELDIENLKLEGSLLIESGSPLGNHRNGILAYGNGCRCSLKNVTIKNRGIDRAHPQEYWKNEIKRNESVKIILHEGAEFHAEDLQLNGSQIFEVPRRHRLVLSFGKRELFPIDHPTWDWNYAFHDQNRILLTKIK